MATLTKIPKLDIDSINKIVSALNGDHIYDIFILGNLGIGKKYAQEKVDVEGTIAQTGFRLHQNGEYINRVIVSDDRGYGTWVSQQPNNFLIIDSSIYYVWDDSETWDDSDIWTEYSSQYIDNDISFVVVETNGEIIDIGLPYASGYNGELTIKVIDDGGINLLLENHDELDGSFGSHIFTGENFYLRIASHEDHWHIIGSDSNSLTGGRKFGDTINGDYTEILDDGTLKYRGDATVWKDMVADLFGRRLYSSVGTIDYDYDENALVFSRNGSIIDVNDRVGANFEINHEFKVGSNISFYPHIHWWQSSTAEYEFTMRYRLQRNGESKSTVWGLITTSSNTANNVFEYVSGTLNQITKFDPITFSNCGISDTIQFQITRSDSIAGDIYVYFMDIHGEIDSDGSDEEFVKTT